MSAPPTPTPRGFGWVPDIPDHRDYRFALTPQLPGTMPAQVDLRPKMPPVYSQGNIGCHDEATDVLTIQGWMRWADYKGDLPIGTINQATGLLEYQHPTALHVHEYDGPLVYGEHSSMDFAVTPNHRMYIRKWSERTRTLESEYRFIDADKIGWYAGLMHAPSGSVGIQLDSVTLGRRTMSGDDFAALVALVGSDGWTGGGEHTKGRVSFCCFREDRYPMVAELAARLGFSEGQKRKGVWVTTDHEMAAWFRENLYTAPELGARNKRIPTIIKSMSQHQIERFLHFWGDQHIGQSRHFYTSSRAVADGLQQLIIQIGRRASIHEGRAKDTLMTDGRRIRAENCATPYTLVEWRSNTYSIERKRNIGRDRYKGPVFCATVPNSTVVTRRNDQILISGNSCVSHAVAAAVEYQREVLGFKSEWVPSRLMLYYLAREAEGTIPLDNGCMIRTAIKCIAKTGVCPEKHWTYDDTPANPATWLFPKGAKAVKKPTATAYRSSALHQALEYRRVNTTDADIKAALASGLPVIFGAMLYESLYDPITGMPRSVVPMPGDKGDKAIGGHAMLVVGYNDSPDPMPLGDGHSLPAQHYLVRNSWGSEVQMKGYLGLPYAYLRGGELADDLWTVSRLEG